MTSALALTSKQRLAPRADIGWHCPQSLSVVVPFYNEQDNVEPLLREVVATLRGSGLFEIICVDDGSADATHDALRALKHEIPELRVIRFAANAGQSTAIHTGVKAARGTWIATLDGDGQNDPADIPKLCAERDRCAEGIKLFTGWRIQRMDTRSKRVASICANAIRRRLLRDDTPDTGCGIKLFEREAFLQLPYFDHMHRFLPALMQRAGWSTASVPVTHRSRASGTSKYNNINRALVGIVDLIGVTWLLKRTKRPLANED